MVDTTAHEAPKKSLEDIKEEARKLAFPQDQQLNWNHGPDAATEVKGPSPVSSNGPVQGNGIEGLPAKPVGFSQTGELVGPGPAMVNADPNNPALPPREVSKTIPCRFFPNCKYGDECVFAHISDPTELAKSGHLQAVNAPMSSGPQVGGFYYPGSHAPPYPYPPQDPHASQGGMPVPLEYSSYMNPYAAANGGGYYPPASTAGYAGRAPYYPAGPYGYMVPPQHQQQEQVPPPLSPQANGGPPAALKGAYAEQYRAYSPPQPFSPHQNGVSLSQSPPNHTSPVDMYHALPNGVPPNFTMTGNAAPFQPGQYSAPPQQQQRPAQTEAVMAASGMHSVNGHRKRNSISLNGASARRNSNNNGPSYGPLASAMGRGRPFDTNTPLYIKKRGQTSCTFFANNDCRNGDACEFAHTLPDGSDAKALKQNITGLDGRVGNPQVIEEFRVHKEAKDREWKAGKRAGKETGFEVRGRERLVHPGAPINGDAQVQLADVRQPGKAPARARPNPQQRIPDGADFPALRSESTQRSLSNSPEPSMDVDEKMSASVASLVSEAARSIPSFASAAARGAQVPQPVPVRKGSALNVNGAQKVDSLPHSPMTTAQSLSPDMPSAPLMAEPIAA